MSSKRPKTKNRMTTTPVVPSNPARIHPQTSSSSNSKPNNNTQNVQSNSTITAVLCHPVLRMFVSLTTLFFAMATYSIDPLRQSQRPTYAEFFGTASSMLSGVPNSKPVVFERATLIVLSIVFGLVFGKLIQVAVGKVLPIFQDNKGSWILMFVNILIWSYIFAILYNLHIETFLTEDEFEVLKVTGYLGFDYGLYVDTLGTIACLGSYYAMAFVFDVVLQDIDNYPDWATGLRDVWIESCNGMLRIVVFWIFFITYITFIILFWENPGGIFTIDTDSWVCFDELDRIIFSGFLVLFQLCSLIQDWEFPMFDTKETVYIPGTWTSIVSLDIKEVNILRMESSWVYLAVSFVNLGAYFHTYINQMLYSPDYYGQFVYEACGSIHSVQFPVSTIEDRIEQIDNNFSELISNANTTISSMNARYCNYENYIKWLTSIPVWLALAIFILRIFTKREREEEEIPISRQSVKVSPVVREDSNSRATVKRNTSRKTRTRRSSIEPPKEAFRERERIARTNSGTRLL